MILKIYGKNTANLFELLGRDENDITKAICYCLYKCKPFSAALLKHLNIQFDNLDSIVVAYQEKQEKGVADIEIYDPGNFRIIIEAKKGFNLPNLDQLDKYGFSLNKHSEPVKNIFTLSDSSKEIATDKLPKQIYGIEIKHIQYKEILSLIKKAYTSSRNKDKQLLYELNGYLKEVVFMNNSHSNLVYVVPISGSSIKEHDIERKYHCPVGQKFLKTPTNYIGFRHHGKLQYINHVESYDTYKGEDNKMYFIFNLGPDIIPSKTIKTGKKLRGTKFYADIDLLLTCETIIEASSKTKERNLE